MYRVEFRRKAGGRVIKFRLESWEAVMRWLGEMPSLYSVDIFEEDV